MIEAITELNDRVCVRIAPSSIHGVGIFAARDISKGKRLCLDHRPIIYSLSPGNLSKLLPEVKQLILERWPRAAIAEPFIYPDAVLSAYMNHADDANVKNDIALRDIKAGEELTEDYRLIPGFERIYPFLQPISGD